MRKKLCLSCISQELHIILSSSDLSMNILCGGDKSLVQERFLKRELGQFIASPKVSGQAV